MAATLDKIKCTGQKNGVCIMCRAHIEEHINKHNMSNEKKSQLYDEYEDLYWDKCGEYIVPCPICHKKSYEEYDNRNYRGDINEIIERNGEKLGNDFTVRHIYSKNCSCINCKCNLS